MNINTRDEYYELANELVDYLERWPRLSPAERTRAVAVARAKQAFHTTTRGIFWEQYLADGRLDLRDFDLTCRYWLLVQHPMTAGHAAQAQAELAALVQANMPA